uniref:(California timema) hypothetical protein n=1 Tax=Timema californicum TaxID=61474 RepID=A0A7R9J0X1_TIMCA|nr:unnamed protein product [Timema californicum]
MTDPFEEEQVQFERCVKPTFGDGISYSDIATKLLKENFLLTALELHTELVEAGRELPKLKEFFSNPGNFEQASLRPENLPSIQDNRAVPSLPSIRAYPAGRVPINAKKLEDLATLSNFLIGYNFYTALQAWPRSEGREYNEHMTNDNCYTGRNSQMEPLVSGYTGRNSQMEPSGVRLYWKKQSDGACGVMLRLTKVYRAMKIPSTMRSTRSSSQATLDSLDLTRYSEDGERGVDERVAVLEFELRKAKETISALRANLTVATESEATTPDTGSVKPLHNESIKPHEQRALNFLINEYLLLHGYKLTSITFADENEHQDFEDWDDVGLNIPKPAEVLTLYRDYMRHAQAPCSDMEVQTDNLPSDTQLQQLLEKRELEQRLWSSESRMEEVSNLTTPGSDVGGVITENISTHSDTPERFELIDAEMKGGEDLDNSRTEDEVEGIQKVFQERTVGLNGDQPRLQVVLG